MTTSTRKPLIAAEPTTIAIHRTWRQLRHWEREQHLRAVLSSEALLTPRQLAVHLRCTDETVRNLHITQEMVIEDCKQRFLEALRALRRRKVHALSTERAARNSYLGQLIWKKKP